MIERHIYRIIKEKRNKKRINVDAKIEKIKGKKHQRSKY